jgi:MarR family transcriptional regulator, transcriptional regulator for hemolysin
MPPRSHSRELLFLISDVARLLRTYADQKARLFGMTRAQWAVLLRLERREGLNLQPITLTRLVDRLCDNGLIERRPDPNDRRAKLLYLTPAARPLLDRIAVHIEELSETVLQDIEPGKVDLMLAQFGTARENLKRAIERNGSGDPAKAKRYG